MSIEARATVENTRFRFKSAKPRIAACLLIVLAVLVAFMALHPEEFFQHPGRGRLGWVDDALRALPPGGQSLVAVGFGLTFLYVLATRYLPVFVNDGLVVFDGRSLSGFDVLGRKRSILCDDVRSVEFRNGGADVRGRENSIRIPLSLMNLDEAQDSAIRALLREAGG